MMNFSLKAHLYLHGCCLCLHCLLDQENHVRISRKKAKSAVSVKLRSSTFDFGNVIIEHGLEGSAVRVGYFFQECLQVGFGSTMQPRGWICSGCCFQNRIVCILRESRKVMVHSINENELSQGCQLVVSKTVVLRTGG